ncbi:3-oxoacyl-[acyl-carrier-protein] synthase III C-terminal domain-containing protein [Sphingomonas sp. KC8]|uniref:3-oxoacyl-[acyl-carrier-protein] synthase III C-terminal domain-containing protein n=1 Tax=Sphingomonas sp. KC8 TaxID=1030157 RepID=UPI0002488627|nr:3-oxoacyl-[acyl-carrier-protein] synthase III C-terminal domain-containing protein [Sphingomonas sp. KC8]
MLDTGIISIAAYLPRLRLARQAIVNANKWANPALASLAKGHRTICTHDEDSLTMGVEAGRNCMAATPGFSADLVQFASTTAPFADRANAVILAEALALPADLRCADFAGFQGCGVTALIDALENGRPTLTVAADKRVARVASAQELTLGHGAAAVATGTRNPIARFVVAHCTSVDFVDHYRAAKAQTDYLLEERWVRDEGHIKLAPAAIKAVLQKAAWQAGDADHVIIAGVGRNVARQIADLCAIAPDRLADTLDASCGETGSAHALIMLCHVLERAAPGQKILLANVAQGCQTLLLETTDAIAAWKSDHTVRQQLDSGVEDENYLRFLSFSEQIDVDWGVRAERDNRTALSAFNRHRKAVTGFIGGLCTACGARQFPKGQYCVNPECRQSDALVDEPFQHKTGTVKSYTEDWLAVTTNPPLRYGNVSFDDGGVIMMEFSDFEPGQLAVGTPVRCVFRIKDRDPRRRFHRYFWKAAPLSMMKAR